LGRGLIMTRDETKQLIRVIASIYPNWKPQNISDTVDAWAWALEEFNFKDIQMALKVFQRTSGSAFAPSTAELIAMINKPKELSQLSESEAWAKVRVAIRNGIYGAEDEYRKLPPEIQKAVGGAPMIRQWAMVDSDELDTVISSNFMRSYKTILKREAEKEALPAELKALLVKNDSLMIEG